MSRMRIGLLATIATALAVIAVRGLVGQSQTAASASQTHTVKMGK